MYWMHPERCEECIGLSERDVNILGVGNPLMGDDGVGPAAIERLGARGVPRGVHLWDAGLAVSDVLGMLDPADPLQRLIPAPGILAPLFFAESKAFTGTYFFQQFHCIEIISRYPGNKPVQIQRDHTVKTITGKTAHRLTKLFKIFERNPCALEK